jgi:hypothetical protein
LGFFKDYDNKRKIDSLRKKSILPRNKDIESGRIGSDHHSMLGSKERSRKRRKKNRKHFKGTKRFFYEKEFSMKR